MSIEPILVCTGKWIKFYLTGHNPKTSIFSVFTLDDSVWLGDIKWAATWRKYAFFPQPDTFYEETCLKGISDFIIEATLRHKTQSTSDSLIK